MIIDCFPFFDELDLLEIRLNELHDVVDVFVLTESPFTFTGIEKPLYFADNKDRYKEFNIIHTVYQPIGNYIPTEYEKHQKQYNIDRAFDFFTPGDIVIQGDCDEIPKANVIKEAIREDWKSARLVMTLFYYWMNCIEKDNRRVWKNSIMSRPDGLYKYNAKQNDKTDKVYLDAGWHFSFLGDVQSKLRAWGHAPEYDKPPFNTTEHIEKCKEQGLELFERKGKARINFEFVTDLRYLPEYVLHNLPKFDKYLWTQQ